MCILSKACKAGNLNFVKELVESGANIRSKNDYPMFCSIKKGHLEIVKYLVESGVDILDDDSAIFVAAEKGHLELVKYFVELGVAMSEDDGVDSISVASEKGHLSIVKYLAGLGIAYDRAILTAAKNGRSEIVKYLMGLGVNEDVVKNSLRLASSGGYVEVVDVVNKMMNVPGGEACLICAFDCGKIVESRCCRQKMCEFCFVKLAKCPYCRQ